MSGPYGPNDAPGPGEGRNDPTQQWGGQQVPGPAGPTQQWGQQPPLAQPTQHWDQTPGQPQQPWGQQPSQPSQQPWGQQPSQPQWGQQPPNQPSQPQWGQTPSQPQWGQQPGQPQQDWGQPGQQPQGQWGQQPQWGAAQQTPPSSGGKSKKGLFIGLGVLAVAVIAAVVALIVVVTSKDELDNSAVQDGVKKVLSDSYGIQDVADVSCPSGQKVQVDATFTCSLKVSGEQKKVTVKITKDDGTYEVGRPN